MLRNFRPIPRNSLGGQVMYLLSIALFSTLIVFSLSVFYFVNRTENIAWRGRQSEAARNAAGTVSGFIQRVKDAMLVVSSVDPGQLASDADELNALLQENTTLLEIVRMDSSGRIFASASRDKSVLASLITIPQSQWFQQARQGKTFIGNVQLSANNEPYLIMAIPSPDSGVVAARVKMDMLWEVVQNIHFGELGRVIVVTNTGDIVSHTNPEFVVSRQTLFGRPEFSEMLNAPNLEWTGSYTNLDQEQVVAATAPISNTNWVVITELPKSKAFAASRTALFVLGIEAFLLMLVASLTLVGYVRRSIVNPMEQLRDGTDRIGQGDLNHRITMTRKDEIGQLASAFNSMAADLEKQQGNLEKAIAYEFESKRARELDILLKASEATSSSLDLDTVLLTLATQLLELSGFESCYISEWDKEANLIHGRVDHSRVFWIEEKRDAYSLSDYPQTEQVLLTGNPIILQGDFEAEEKQWMEQLGRAAVAILALYGQEKVIGLVEIAISGKNKLFTSKGLQKCEEIIVNAAPSLIEPLSANDPPKLFALQEKLLQVSGGDICSFSEWDRSQNKVLTCAVISDQISVMGQNPGINPERDASWKLALQEGKTSVWVHSEGNERIEVVGNGTATVEVESLILFPLQKGDERIGLIELYDFNHKTRVSTEQLTLLRAIADKAGYWIENARLLQQTQKRLEEQTELLHEKEILLKEIHHRVKNNLQVISSLLNLQSSRVTDFQTIQTLRDSQSRVRSMALIHEKLYQSQSLAKIDFGEYVKSLANDLFRSYRQSFTGVQLNVQTDEVFLELDQAIPCGLILNELITNALKYAFPDGRNGIIKVELRTDFEHNISLRVADDGVGIPLDFDILNAKSLGLQLVNSLVAQLDGRLELGNSHGTDYLVSFRC